MLSLAFAIGIVAQASTLEAVVPDTLSFAGGLCSWELASTARRRNLLVRSGVEFELSEHFSLRSALDYTSNGEGTEALRFTNRRLGWTAGVSFRQPTGRFVFDAGLGLGALFEAASIEDTGDSFGTAIGVRAIVDATAAAAMRLSDSWLLGIRAGARFHPWRLDQIMLLEVSYVLGAAPAPSPASEE
jgi:hypothetical protein